MFGSSTSSSWRTLEARGGFRSLPNQDSSALSVSGRLTSHDQSCLSVSGGLPDCSEVMIHRACWCLEASQGAPAWLLDVFWSSTSSSWRILEALGGSRSLQNQDPSALSVSGRLTSHDLSCLSVSGGLPECSEVTIYRACRCLEASWGVTGDSEPASTQLRPTFGPPSTHLIVGGLGPALQRSLDL